MEMTTGKNKDACWVVHVVMARIGCFYMCRYRGEDNRLEFKCLPKPEALVSYINVNLTSMVEIILK